MSQNDIGAISWIRKSRFFVASLGQANLGLEGVKCLLLKVARQTVLLNREGGVMTRLEFFFVTSMMPIVFIAVGCSTADKIAVTAPIHNVRTVAADSQAGDFPICTRATSDEILVVCDKMLDSKVGHSEKTYFTVTSIQSTSIKLQRTCLEDPSTHKLLATYSIVEDLNSREINGSGQLSLFAFTTDLGGKSLENEASVQIGAKRSGVEDLVSAIYDKRSAELLATYQEKSFFMYHTLAHIRLSCHTP
jgi:hypothetical protein